MSSLDDYLFWLQGRKLNGKESRKFFIKMAYQIRKEYDKKFWLHGIRLRIWCIEFNKFFKKHDIPYYITGMKGSKGMFMIQHRR